MISFSIPATPHCLYCANNLFSGGAFGSDRIYHEDFSTKEFCDQAHTEALWDTVAGELQLYPFEITLRGSINTPGTAYDVAIAGDYAYIADWTNGLVIIDISNTAGPITEGTCNTPGSAFGVAVAGDYAYVADQSEGLQIIDISNPASPAIVGSYNTSGNAYDVILWGNLAYVADGSGGLVIIDISDPLSPSLLGSHNHGSEVYQILSEGDYLYIRSDIVGGVYIFDVSAPSLPDSISTLSASGWRFDISGDFAFVAESTCICIYDVSDPSNPTYLSYTSPSSSSSSHSICLAGYFLYGTGNDGLKVYWTFGKNFLPGNQVVSLPVADPDSAAVAVRLSTEQSGLEDVTWAFFTDDPADYVFIAPDNEFHFIDENDRGDRIHWRAWLDHSIAISGISPSCSSLELEWLFNEPAIDSIVDVSEDQGGWARIHFGPSALDIEGSPDTATGYNICRRVDDPVAASRILNDGNREVVLSEETKEEGIVELPDPLSVISYQEGRYILGSSSGTAALPPGTWEVIGYIGAYKAKSYIYLAPTLEDSSTVFDLTAYCVMALTASGSYYVSLPDSGYSVDNIAPGVPTGLAVTYNTGSGNELLWDQAPEEDFQYFRVYRGNSEEFVPGPENLACQTASTGWSDPDYDGWNGDR